MNEQVRARLSTLHRVFINMPVRNPRTGNFGVCEGVVADVGGQVHMYIREGWTLHTVQHSGVTTVGN